MQKNENIFVLSGVLFVITAVVALLLATVNQATAARIDDNVKREQNEARMAILQEADEFVEIAGEFPEPVQQIFAGQRNGQTMGYCVNVTPAGFGGVIDMMVGIRTEGELTGVKIISMSETPGLGAKIQDESFCGQFVGKAGDGVLRLIKGGEAADDEIVAVTGATISSQAVTEGVQAAMEAVRQVKEAAAQ